MADIIYLLPDNIANQIAAGEVIQRPGSVIKELMENSIDAGATQIKVIIKDAGKSLIQVIDNGKGMTYADARMCFERHATSKLKKAEDLFTITTMGFRGEAMASIASVAQIELKTRRAEDDLGTRILLEASEVTLQEPCQCPVGTSISVKNLFCNIPARRKFLKTDIVEQRHMHDEFQRIALAWPEVFFSLFHDQTEMYHLPSSNLRQRIVNLFGSNINNKLVPLDQATDTLSIYGYIGKPEYAKRSKSEQFLFVNGRYIKSPYLNHAITSGYDNLLPQDQHPVYVVFMSIDPKNVDVNVHPTKQEIKFEDERLVYNFLQVAVKHALGKHQITPMLDFEQEQSMSPYKLAHNLKSGEYSGMPREASPSDPNLQNWQRLYETVQSGAPRTSSHTESSNASFTIETEWNNTDTEDITQNLPNYSEKKKAFQLHNSYLVNQLKSGFMLVDQQAAHERILFERFENTLTQHQGTSTQNLLFPETIDLSTADYSLSLEILPSINALGFDIRELNKNTLIIHGIPGELTSNLNAVETFQQLLEQVRNDRDLKVNAHTTIAKALAKQLSIKRGKSLTTEEATELIDQLFACEIPHASPGGRKCFIVFELGELEQMFK